MREVVLQQAQNEVAKRDSVNPTPVTPEGAIPVAPQGINVTAEMNSLSVNS